MSNYSVTDIEVIRARSDLSYQEAMDLLDYHDGSIAAALTDLEMNGRLKTPVQEEKKIEEDTVDMEKERVNAERERCREEAKACAKDAGARIGDFLKKLCRIRLRIGKEGRQNFEFPLVLGIVFGFVSFPLTVTAVILGVIFGYSFQVDTNGVTF